MNQMAASVQSNSETAAEVDKLSMAASSAATQGGTVMQTVVKTMDDIAVSTQRIGSITSLIDDIAFQRIDLRLAQRLLAMAEGDRVNVTHQQLATELGSAREVISRALAEFQRRGWIEQARGELRLTNRDALEKLTQSAEQ